MKKNLRSTGLLLLVATPLLAGCLTIVPTNGNFGGKPQDIEKWYVYVRTTSCESSSISSAKGTLNIAATSTMTGVKHKSTKGKELDAKCKKNSSKKWGYSGGDVGMLTLVGTRDQIRSYQIGMNLHWKYNPGVKKREHNKNYTNTPLQTGLRDEETKDITWKVGAKAKPDFTLKLRFKRKN